MMKTPQIAPNELASASATSPDLVVVSVPCNTSRIIPNKIKKITNFKCLLFLMEAWLPTFEKYSSPNIPAMK